jgi:hypothetical protein
VNALSELSGAMRSGRLQRYGSERGHKSPFPFPGNMAVTVDEITQIPQAGGSESTCYSGYIGGAQPWRKPPQREGGASESLAHTHVFWEQSYNQIAADIDELKAGYIFRNAAAIVDFVSRHRTVAHVLSNALPQLKQSFGEDVVFNLEVIREDDDSSSVYAIVVWRGPAEGAEAALEDFDERWWLNQAPQPGLTFTYELA